MLAVACAGTSDADGADQEEGAVSAAAFRAVAITVSNEVADTYESR